MRRSWRLERDRGVEQDDDHLGELHRPQAVGDRQFLQLFLHLGPFAHACGVEDAHGRAVPGHRHGDRVAGDPASGPVSRRSSPMIG
jgi:hypothetical protein